MPLTIFLNGQPRTFPAFSDPVSLEELVRELGLKGDRVAIERNGEIASKASWPSTLLSENDRLEIVHFVGGGSN